MTATTRRNDPCPCGSGLRYKECHGKLATSTAPPAPSVERALQAHQQGRVEEAERLYRQLLEAEPGHAVATHYLGLIAWQRGDRAQAERAMRESIAANGAIPDFHNNLGNLLRDTGRTDEAVASFRRALEIDPGWAEAQSNLGLVLEDAGRHAEAEQAYRAALALEPRFAAAQQNLARLLLLLGRFDAAWEHYRWRLVAQGRTNTPPDASAQPFPPALTGRRLVLLAEQGVGDVLFFLRFAPELVRRGTALAFRGDPRLHSLLERTGLFTLGCGADNAPAPGLEPCFIGDLPWLLGATDPARLPEPLPLTPLRECLERVRAALAASGPGPYVALTWRSGVAPVGPARTQLKQTSVQALGTALKGARATWISVQRNPAPGEREALEAALGEPVHDFSTANGDLEEMLALMSEVAAYVGTSNANTHLRAALGKGQHVLVPDPPEWRWMAAGTASPWFAAMRIYRSGDTGWEGALRGLRPALGL